MRIGKSDIPFIVAFMVLILVFVFSVEARAPWRNECFGTIDALTAKLNQLSDASAADAKVIVAPSSRNVGGWLGSPYCLVYR